LFDSQIEILPNGQVMARVWNLPAVLLGTASFHNWHHAVLRYDQTGAGKLDGFLDGVKSVTFSTGQRWSPQETVGFNLDLRYTFGAGTTTNLDNNDGGGLKYFAGRVADFRIWNVARTDAAIAAEKNRRLNATRRARRLLPPGRLFWGSVVKDSTPFALNGTANGSIFSSGFYVPSRFRPPVHLGVADPDFDGTRCRS